MKIKNYIQKIFLFQIKFINDYQGSDLGIFELSEPDI